MTEVEPVEKLAQRFQQRSEVAFEQLLVKHRANLGNFLLRYMHDLWRIEDLIQETFIKAYRYRERYDGRVSFKTWLFTIALNVYKDSKRAKKDAMDFTTQEATGYGTYEDHRTHPDSVVQHQELARKIKELVHSLPEEQKEVFLLYRYEELSSEEIARVVGRAVGTVKSQMHLALKKIRAGLEVMGYEV